MSEARQRFREEMEGEFSTTVTPEMAASAYGNEHVQVLATPRVVWLREGAAVAAVRDALRPDEATVGTCVDITHRAATPIGMRVTARARLERIDGRRLTFAVEAHDELEQVAAGTHERFVVDLPRFLAGAERKASGPSGWQRA